MQRAWAHINKYPPVVGPGLKAADEIILDKYFLLLLLLLIPPFIILMASLGVFFTRISKQKCRTSSNFHCRRVGWYVGGECSYNGS